MPRTSPATVLLTGASGQIGSQLCSLLRAGGHEVLAVDVHPNAQEKIELCDIRRTDHVGRLFESAAIRTVIHLAAVLPTAFRADPLAAAEVNLTGTLLLLRAAVTHGVERFVFGSIAIPFAPSAQLSLTHVDEVARMLLLLAEAADLPRRIYNSPAEVWETQRLAELVQRVRNIAVRMGEEDGGPTCDGTLFTQDFGFRLRGLADYLSGSR